MSVKEFDQFVNDVYDKTVSIASSNPTVVYENRGLCFYTSGRCLDKDGDIPFGYGCLIGQAILEVDSKLYDFLSDPKNEGEGIVTIMQRIGYEFFDSNVQQISKSAKERISKLEKIQNSQDLGKLWGECVWSATLENNMYVLQNKNTGEIVDPRDYDFILSPEDFGPYADWEDVFSQNLEVDIVEGYATIFVEEV